MENFYKLVGSVVDIDGPRLEFTRRSPVGIVYGWYQAIPGTKIYLNDIFRTQPHTTGTIEFLIGGRAVLPPGTVNQVVTPKDITEVYDPTEPLRAQMNRRSAKKLWEFLDRFDKQDKVFHIQSAGGATIEG